MSNKADAATGGITDPDVTIDHKSGRKVTQGNAIQSTPANYPKPKYGSQDSGAQQDWRDEQSDANAEILKAYKKKNPNTPIGK